MPFERSVGADLRGVRVDHDAQWELLQVRELRRDERLQLARAV